MISYMPLVPAQSNWPDDAGFLDECAAVGSNAVDGAGNFARINKKFDCQGNKSTDFRQSKDITTHGSIGVPGHKTLHQCIL
jgi:hypothetical protein